MTQLKCPFSELKPEPPPKNKPHAERAFLDEILKVATRRRLNLLESGVKHARMPYFQAANEEYSKKVKF